MAADLAVRAASGVSSAQVHNAVNSVNGVFNTANYLGLALGPNAAPTKLSRERKYRMRELATQKLSYAYHLDEIAASVATMQSTSTLEDLAQLVLVRNPNDYDARYVNFFHERIPSRMMAEFTPLEPLDALISERSNNGSPLRTRALTKIFKKDLTGSVRDLTEGLAVARWSQAQHRNGPDQLSPPKMETGDFLFRMSRGWRNESKLDEEDHPSSLESQMLFHRAGIHLRLACQHVQSAMDAWKSIKAGSPIVGENHLGEASPQVPDKGEEAHLKHLELRKIVKTNAKRAHRDYLDFLSNFDYTAGTSYELPQISLTRRDKADRKGGSAKLPHPRETENLSAVSSTNDSVPNKSGNQSHASTLDRLNQLDTYVFKVSELFTASQPSNLPPFPPFQSTELGKPGSSKTRQAPEFFEANNLEGVTYHPLLAEALHSMLLCHVLLQTPPTELRRHAYNVARLVRLLSGYPIFLNSRSTSRADWSEILRRTDNWLDLIRSWTDLCQPVPSTWEGRSGEDDIGLRSRTAGNANTDPTPKHDDEHVLHEAILEALADERVVDEESFQRAVHARETEMHGNPPTTAGAELGNLETTPTEHVPEKDAVEEEFSRKKRTPDSPKEHPGLSTERAEAITRWVQEAPQTVEGAKSKKSRKKRPDKKPIAEEEPLENVSTASISKG
jgi:hypothetical protein